RSAGTPRFSTGARNRSTTNIWKSSSQHESAATPLSGKLGADQGSRCGWVDRFLRAGRERGRSRLAGRKGLRRLVGDPRGVSGAGCPRARWGRRGGWGGGAAPGEDQPGDGSGDQRGGGGLESDGGDGGGADGQGDGGAQGEPPGTSAPDSCREARDRCRGPARKPMRNGPLPAGAACCPGSGQVGQWLALPRRCAERGVGNGEPLRVTGPGECRSG